MVDSTKHTAVTAAKPVAVTAAVKPVPKKPAAKASDPALDHPNVDPDNIPVETSAGVQPDAHGDKLFAAALAKAPHLTKGFVKEHGLDDEWLARVARGEEPPPPYTGPDPVVDLHLTPGGWQITPKGVKPEDVGKNAISR